MNPSIYSTYGVFERDFFQSRSENEIRQIFDSIGFAMTNDAFQEVWQAAKELSENGEVGLQTSCSDSQYIIALSFRIQGE